MTTKWRVHFTNRYLTIDHYWIIITCSTIIYSIRRLKKNCSIGETILTFL